MKKYMYMLLLCNISSIVFCSASVASLETLVTNSDEVNAFFGTIRNHGDLDLKELTAWSNVLFKGNRPLHFAVECRNDLAVKQLLAAGADPNGIDSDEFTPLLHAIYENNLSMVRMLLEMGANMNAESLMYAYKSNTDFEIIDLLLSKISTDITRHRDEDGNTLLHCVKRPADVHVLMSRGAQINIRNNYNQTPFDTAMNCRRFDVVKMFLQYYLEPRHIFSIYYNCLYVAVIQCDIDKVKVLLDRNNINIQDFIDIINDIDAGSRRNERKTLLQIATEKNHTEIIELLHQFGAR